MTLFLFELAKVARSEACYSCTVVHETVHLEASVCLKRDLTDGQMFAGNSWGMLKRK